MQHQAPESKAPKGFVPESLLHAIMDAPNQEDDELRQDEATRRQMVKLIPALGRLVHDHAAELADAKKQISLFEVDRLSDVLLWQVNEYLFQGTIEYTGSESSPITIHQLDSAHAAEFFDLETWESSDDKKPGLTDSVKPHNTQADVAAVKAEIQAENDKLNALRSDKELNYHVALLALEFSKLLSIHARSIALDNPAGAEAAEGDLLRLLLEMITQAEVSDDYFATCLKPRDLTSESVAIWFYAPGQE